MNEEPAYCAKNTQRLYSDDFWAATTPHPTQMSVRKSIALPIARPIAIISTFPVL